MKPSKNSFDIVRETLVVALQLDVAEAQSITTQTTPANLAKWDSLTHVKLFLELEDSFGIKFDVAEIVELSSVESIIRGVDDKRR